jgi:hypothetical protein
VHVSVFRSSILNAAMPSLPVIARLGLAPTYSSSLLFFSCKLLVRNPLRAWNPHTALLRGGVGWEKEVECGEFDIVKLVMYVPIRPSTKFPH